MRQVIESFRAKKRVKLLLQQRFGKAHLEDLSDHELRETAIWALSLQDTLPGEGAPSAAVMPARDRGGT